MNPHFKVTDTMPVNPTPEAKRVWINWVPNVDLGHVLTMISFAVGLASVWNLQDRRITILEQKIAAYEQSTQEMRVDVKDIKSVLNQVQQSLAVQAYIVNQPRSK